MSKISKLSFDSEKLIVDWVGLNIEGRPDLGSIADYFFEKLNFNSIVKKSKNGKSEYLKYKAENKFLVSFLICDDEDFYWTGVKVNFSGINGAYFYNLINLGQVDFRVFDLNKTKLSRLDINYFRERKNNDNVLVSSFLSECKNKILKNSSIKKVFLEKNMYGCILKVGSRKSPKYYRIYEKKEGLKFEIELKKESIVNLGEFLFSNQLKDLEDFLSRQFYRDFLKLLVLTRCYTDWLLVGARKLIKPRNSLVTSYMENNLTCDKKYLMQLIQFLSFLKGLKGFKTNMADQGYYLLDFCVSDFLYFQNIRNECGKKRQNSLLKTVVFLRSLQNLAPIVTSFSETSFRSCVMFPYLSVKKERKSWVVKLAVLEELYLYDYPFSFPKNFLVQKGVHDMEVKFNFLHSMSKVCLEKKISVQVILGRSSISNKIRAKIKSLIKENLIILKNENLIEPDVKLVDKNGSELSITIQELTPLLIGKVKDIYFYEKINT